MSALIAVLPGDGIGPEVTEQAMRVLDKVARIDGRELDLRLASVGGVALDRVGDPLPPETLEMCATADAILLGAVGGPAWDDADLAARPEQGLLRLRRELDLFANLRPVRTYGPLSRYSPVKERLLRGVDFVLVRELTSGLYFGRRRGGDGWCSDECRYTEAEIERVVRVACGLARERSGRLTSVDKANVLATSRLWRRTTERVAAEYPEVTLEHLLVDAAAMHLITRPADFDVVVTENLFGDILSDEVAVLSGSLGMMPSAALSADRRGLYEPVHGSAPELVGRGVANPYGAILSAAMLLRWSLRMTAAADAVEAAVEAALAEGFLTRDLDPDGAPVTTDQAGDAVLRRLGVEGTAHPVASLPRRRRGYGGPP